MSIEHEQSATDEQVVIKEIDNQISKNAILLYMKGTPQQPQCGFSAKAVQALSACEKPFGFVNILENPEIRAILPKHKQWPTFPQLYVNGELIGGSDIIMEMYDDGELQALLEQIDVK
tara:strand:- start:52500 stop:52853 length:354 start_codon:yes stop_codon:yes gene_type:complete